MKIFFVLLCFIGALQTSIGQSYSLLEQSNKDKVNQDILILFNKYLNYRVGESEEANHKCAGKESIIMKYNILDYQLDTASFSIQSDSLFLSGVFEWRWAHVFTKTIDNCCKEEQIEREKLETYRFEALFLKEDEYWIISSLKAPNVWKEDFYFYSQ